MKDSGGSKEKVLPRLLLPLTNAKRLTESVKKCATSLILLVNIRKGSNRIRRLERVLYAPLRSVTSETTETIQPEMDLPVTEDTQVTRLHDAKFAFRKGATNGRQP